VDIFEVLTTWWELNQNKTVTIKVPPFPESVNPVPEPTPGPVEEIKALVGHKFGASDEPNYRGQYYLILPDSLVGKAESVTVGGVSFTKRPVKGYAEVWYGPSSSGNITVRAGSLIYTTTQSGGGGTQSETAKVASYANGNRAHFRFSKPGSGYGKNISVTLGNDKVIVPDGSQRYEGPGGFLWKPVSENNHKLVVLGKTNVKYSSCTINYS
jgi:hypothetical protein